MKGLKGNREETTKHSFLVSLCTGGNVETIIMLSGVSPIFKQLANNRKWFLVAKKIDWEKLKADYLAETISSIGGISG